VLPLNDATMKKNVRKMPENRGNIKKNFLVVINVSVAVFAVFDFFITHKERRYEGYVT
jgi:hypothetical protein